MTPTGKERLLNWGLGAITAAGIVLLTSFINKRTYESNKSEIVIENLAEKTYVDKQDQAIITEMKEEDTEIKASMVIMDKKYSDGLIGISNQLTNYRLEVLQMIDIATKD